MLAGPNLGIRKANDTKMKFTKADHCVLACDVGGGETFKQTGGLLERAPKLLLRTYQDSFYLDPEALSAKKKKKKKSVITLVV